MNYLTAQFALVERGHLRAGETVLVHGAAGGVGTATIQVARGLGARTIAVVSTEAKGEMARRAGADEVVPLDGFKDAVAGLTDGRGVDIVLDVVGGDVFTDSLRCLGTQGRLLVVGFASGQGIPEVKVNRLLLNNVDVRGVGWGAYAMTRPTYMGEQWQALLPLMESGAIRPADRRDVRPGRDRAGTHRHGRAPHAGQVGAPGSLSGCAGPHRHRRALGGAHRNVPLAACLSRATAVLAGLALLHLFGPGRLRRRPCPGGGPSGGHRLGPGTGAGRRAERAGRLRQGRVPAAHRVRRQDVPARRQPGQHHPAAPARRGRHHRGRALPALVRRDG